MESNHSRPGVVDHMSSLVAQSGAQEWEHDSPPSPLTQLSQTEGPAPVIFQDADWGLHFADSLAAAANTGQQ